MQVEEKKTCFKFAVVCASNQNRSMNAHSVLAENGYKLDSYGTATKVKLPGPSFDRPNVYDFGTPYKQIYEDLKQKDKELYRSNGLLKMVKRNFKTKDAPERWQLEQNKRYDIVITYEERVFNTLLNDMKTRNKDFERLHVLNMTVTDNHQEAEVGAKDTLDLINLIEESGENWEDELDSIVEKFQQISGRTILHQISFY